jgi:Rrf2 family protein
MFSKKVAYAVRCLVYLAEINESVLIRDISEATDIPHPYLAKIVNDLTRKGFVKSQRGIGGGIALAKNPESISICEVCIAFDDPFLKQQCIIGMPDCSSETGCVFHPFWSKEKERITNFLSVNTIDKIAKARRKSKRA